MQIVVEIAEDGSVRAYSHHRTPEVVIIDRRDDEAAPLRNGKIVVEARFAKTDALLVEAGVEVDQKAWAGSKEIALARKFYADEDSTHPVEVDDDARAARTDEGVFVEMWGFVSNDDLNSQEG
ncbi:hypothetical protein [Geoalkalibacter subterraneus]|uniref:Uncharacterized protein n=1 Tax=Geoalkalibacter subterraneus TaxID=483547 RepID=A0A0B5FLG2_9BACT|nr:hypothetical protein [Geoalkalibacter subterraneus]AJF08273.1 hypothetical protein GSUB_17505 [Geoalkalibacter subterraneus]